MDGARQFGYIFNTRTPTSVEITALGEQQTYEVLNVIEFTSARKRMSVIVRTPDGRIKLFCKGADSLIYERLANRTTTNREEGADFREITLSHLEAFATEGLRTLCFAAADIPESLYQVCTVNKCSIFSDNNLVNLDNNLMPAAVARNLSQSSNNIGRS